ncbi:hypothetical protein [Streptomyces sp. NPDC005498]|uniref:competence protein CoiA family protein n=1 Tax=Streptomyces sp. NPDC005498 TaxID=3364717 RepID=UPI00369B858C
MDIFSAEDAPADGAPFMCPACRSRVYPRHSPHQRPHWAHYTGAERCEMHRDAVSGGGYLLRLAEEINTYAKEK